MTPTTGDSVTPRSRRTFLVSAVAAAAAAGAASCSNSGSGSDDGAITLEYWTWTPNMQGVIDSWNNANPDIQVNLTEIVGLEATSKFLAAIQAGSGAPDVMHTEYQSIPTYVARDALIDISQYVRDDVGDQFSEGLWNSVTLGTEAVYGVPQDSGPMSLLYRDDVFEQFGLQPPATWDEFAETARALHAADPTYYLTNFDPKQTSWTVGYAQQAGASWWSVSDGQWSVNVDDEPTRKTVDYWGGLLEEDVISLITSGTPEYNAALAEGKLAAIISGAWAGATLPDTVPDTAGKWRAAPVPQWDLVAPMNGAIGGSAEAVCSQTEYPEQAVEFIQWMNASQEGVSSLVKTAGLFPASDQHGPPLLTDPPEFFSNQPDFWEVLVSSGQNVSPFTFGPNFSYVTSELSDKMSPPVAARSRSGLLAALSEVQAGAEADLATQGFSQ